MTKIYMIQKDGEWRVTNANDPYGVVFFHGNDLKAAYDRGYQDGAEFVEAEEVGNGREPIAWEESWEAYRKELMA